jgi:hypothetical protein
MPQLPKFPSALRGLEKVLALLTGRTNWPSTKAVIDSRIAIPTGIVTGGFGGSGFASAYLVLTYEVGGISYTRACRIVAGHQEHLKTPNKTISIQYNPRHPKNFYYPDACQLASKTVLACVIGAGALVIIREIVIH